MRIAVDIDGIICQTEGNDYVNAVPIPENIARINKLFDEGNTIIYWTARGSTSGKNWRDFTFHQLKSWGCKCDNIVLGKMSYDIIVDDKAIKISEL